ncbi:hypothetical protein ACFX2B_044224 [Malus domestica]
MVIVTELLLGGTLRKYLFSMRPRCLDTCVAVGFALDIARAMECLHSHGIIHRDLKPENLILTADQKTVKLADFGLAREESLTEMMTAKTGTYRWMAPELYSTVTLRHGEKKHYNHKVDAYSFAIVLWELIHNKLPFEGMSNLQAAYAAAFKNVRPSAESLPKDLALIVTSCWKEDPNDWPNFTQIIQMLLRYLSTILAPAPAIPQRIFKSENAVLPPESPGTSSLMATHNDSGETPKSNTHMEDKPKGAKSRIHKSLLNVSICSLGSTVVSQQVRQKKYHNYTLLGFRSPTKARQDRFVLTEPQLRTQVSSTPYPTETASRGGSASPSAKDSEPEPEACRAWLINSRGLANKVKNASQSSACPIKDWGANRDCPNCHFVIDNSDVLSEWPGLPVGVKFDPSAGELLEHLAAKCDVGNSQPHMFIDEFIPTLEGDNGIYCDHPENLPGK